MKFAVMYRRISDKDQSNHSLTAQETHISRFAEDKGYSILADFCDDGRSAKNFDRVGWKALVKYLKANDNVKTVLVYDYSRFSRNAGEALELIESYEKIQNIHILSVSQIIPLDHSDPMYFHFRANLLVQSETEWRVIQDRTLRGIHAARESGRLGNRAPYGYINIKRTGEKPQMEKSGDAIHDKVLENIHNDFFIEKMNLSQVGGNARRLGFDKKGNSAIRRILSNPSYYGIVFVPEYRGKKSYYRDAIHEGYFPKELFSIAKNMLENRERSLFQAELPLRGVLRGISSDTLLSGSKSKGKMGKYYWYYRHPGKTHKEYYSAKKIDQNLCNVLSQMSFTENQLNFLRSEINRIAKINKVDNESSIRIKKKEITELTTKIEKLEERFIINEEITSSVYNKWSTKLNSSLIQKRTVLEQMEYTVKDSLSSFEKHMMKLTDLASIYKEIAVIDKQRLIIMLFGQEFRVCKQGFGTLKLHSMFMDKANEISGLYYLEKTKVGMNFTSFPLSSPNAKLYELSNSIKLIEFLAKVG